MPSFFKQNTTFSPQLIAEETFLGFINKAAAGYDSYVYCYTIFNKIVDFKSR